jgi:hypothetical protein
LWRDYIPAPKILSAVEIPTEIQYLERALTGELERIVSPYAKIFTN